MSITLAATLLAGIFAISGVLAIVASVANLDWFFRAEGVKMLTYKLKRTYSRILYGVIGITLLAVAGRLLRDVGII